MGEVRFSVACRLLFPRRTLCRPRRRKLLLIREIRLSVVLKFLCQRHPVPAEAIFCSSWDYITRRQPQWTSRGRHTLLLFHAALNMPVRAFVVRPECLHFELFKGTCCMQQRAVSVPSVDQTHSTHQVTSVHSSVKYSAQH